MALKVGELFATLNVKDDGFQKKMSSATSSFMSLAAKAISTAATLNTIKLGVNYNAQLEQLQTSFEVMTGSAEDAARVLDRIRDLGASTPFDMPGLAETTQLLMNYGLSADTAIDSMMMLGDIAQGDQDKLTRIATAYGQMSSAGKVALEDIKQMIEAGYNPLQEISETTGESMASLYDRISKGTISIDEITASMKRSTSAGGKYFKSMEKQSKTLNGQLSTLQDTAMQLLGDVVSPINDILTDSILPASIDAVESIQEAFTEGGFAGVGRMMMSEIADGFESAARNLYAAAASIDLGEIWSGVQKSAGELQSGIRSTLGRVKVKASEFITSVDWTGIWDGVTGTASTLQSKAAAAITAVSIKASDYLTGVDWTGIWNGITGTYEALKTKAGEILGKLPEIIGGFIEDAANFTESGQFAALGENIVGFLAAGIESKAGGGAAKVINALSGLFDNISLSGIDDNLRTALSNIGNVVIEALATGIRAAASGAVSLINAVGAVLQSALSEENLSGASSALTGFGSSVLDLITQGITEVADGGTQIMRAFSDLLASINWENVGESIGTFASDIVSNLASKLGEIDATELARALGDMLGKAAGGLVAACAGIVSTIVTNIITDDGWGPLGNALSDLLLGALEFAWETVKAFAISIGEVIVDLITPKMSVEGFSVDNNWVDEAMHNFDAVNAANGITARVTKMVNSGLSQNEIVAELENLKTKFNLTDNDIGTLDESGYWDSLQTAINSYFQQNTITAEVQVEPDVTAESGTGSADFSSVAKEIQDKYVNENTSVPVAIKPEITEADTAELTASASAQIGSAGTEAGTAFGTNVSGAITASLSSVTASVNDVVSAAKTAATSGFSSMANIGLEFARGLAVGIRTGQSVVTAAARSVAQAAADAAKNTLQIHSPSRVTMGLGRYFGEGFARGITSTVSLATGAANDLARSAAGAATIRNPGARAQAAYTTSTAVWPEIDYERLADAISRRPTYLTQDGVIYAEIQEQNNAIVRNSRARSVALGYGK